MKITYLAGLLALLVLPLHADDPKDVKSIPHFISNDVHSTDIYTGFTNRDHSWYSYAGGEYALNGNIDQAGWFVRGAVGGGQYSYLANNSLQGHARGSLVEGSAGIGYKFKGDVWSLSLFTGPHYRDRSLNVFDPNNVNSSGKFGDLSGLYLDATTDHVYWNLVSQFSTIDISSWNRARIGYQFDPYQITVGPEGIYDRDKFFDEERGGAFVKLQLNDLIGVDLSGGYAKYNSSFGNSSSNSSAYETIGLNFAF
jgi:hypothetical protein